MRNFFIVLILIIAGIAVFVYINSQRNIASRDLQPSKEVQTQVNNDKTPVQVVAKGLDTPWAIAFLTDKSMLVTERAGKVRLIDQSGNLQTEPVAVLDQVREVGEGGLLGIALHPDFPKNNYVYLYYTYSSEGNNTLNRVVRMNYQEGKLINEQVIVDLIPGASNHNGGRIKFGPDNFLYITTGDAQEPSLAQNTNSLAGKILRVTDEGKSAPGNSFNNLSYSYGHRNPQGLAWNESGELWSTEHGPSGVPFGHDEINLIEAGKNYGWPTIYGDQSKNGLETPRLNSGLDTWAPVGSSFVGNSLFFGGLRGQALFEYNIQSNELKEHFKGEFGRIREVIIGSDEMLYISTSNLDGRGSPKSGDDKIIRINPQKL